MNVHFKEMLTYREQKIQVNKKNLPFNNEN